jgi:hypothetical protein
MMLMIVWNPLGFHLLDTPPQGRTFNPEYHPDSILTELLPLHSQVDERGLVIYADNASPDID